MDTSHRFHTPETFAWVRAEHIALVTIAALLAMVHFAELHLARFVVAFLLIDLIGYVPGAISFRRRGGGVLPPAYHHLYNFTHSYLTAGAAVGLWALAIGGLEWAMLALPIHLSGDRGLFGNTYKPTSLPFEPTVVPSVEAFAPFEAKEI